jgi:hypothetical protein
MPAVEAVLSFESVAQQTRLIYGRRTLRVSAKQYWWCSSEGNEVADGRC